MSKNRKISRIKKKLKKFREKVGPHFRIPIPKPGWAHKSKKDYDRKKDKQQLRKELNE